MTSQAQGIGEDLKADPDREKEGLKEAFLLATREEERR